MSENNGSNNIISRDAFFAACRARSIAKVHVPDVGNVNIRKLTLGQLKTFDKATDNYERAKLLILESVVDGNLVPIFQTLDEVDTLEMPIFKALSEAVSDVNALKVTEQEIKNSETAKT